MKTVIWPIYRGHEMSSQNDKFHKTYNDTQVNYQCGIALIVNIELEKSKNFIVSTCDH